MNTEQALAIILANTSQVLPLDELKNKLSSGKKLKVKLGADPTAPDLHLGHAVVLLKMRELQDLGHEIIFLIGDFTAQIGDPTGKSKTRPPLSLAEIQANTQTYLTQVSKILDPKRLTIRYNSEWLAKLVAADLIKLCAKVTLAQLIERDDFTQRFASSQPIGMHELLYPMLQGYDSVALQADIELGGTDQTFNLLMGRYLQQKFDQEPQIILTMPILEGLDGKEKMSKSLGNYIGLTEDPIVAYGKLMSISDQLMWRYAELLLRYAPAEVVQLQADLNSGRQHPMAIKKRIAYDIISKFWSANEADLAQENFEKLFQENDYSAAREIALPAGTSNPIWIVDLLKLLEVVDSSSAARRLIEASAIKINEKTVADFKAEINWQSGLVIKAGKHRIYKLR